MKNETTISFVMPCYNDGDSIGKAVDSLLDQDLKGIEIIIVDDGSDEKTKKSLKEIEGNGLAKVIYQSENRGACTARNRGAKEATGKYLSFLPADAILYPGMATIWFNTLEENPDYDFMYGGYRFVDEDGEPLPNQDYFGAPFDPYLLETSNFIDGSFPIKRESFWKYAKIMDQKDGLWDKSIISLQDWDFWLSVVKNGGKGIYVQDIFFGTTMPHPGGLSYDSALHWIERTEAIKKKHKIPLRNICVASLGAGWHAKRIAHMLNADFKEMPSFKAHHYDAIYVIGFYPEFAAQQDKMFWNNAFDINAGRGTCRKIVHFIGSDVWQLYNVSLAGLRTVWQPYLQNNVDVLLCESHFIKDELEDLGIKNVQVVPLPPAMLYDVRPFPKEFTVACYLPGVNREFYRPKEMIEIAKALPDVKFKFFGNPIQTGFDPALPKNIHYEGYISDMNTFISECTAIMRFPVHDGLPISVLEFLLAGRYSIQSVPIKYTQWIKDFSVDNVVEAIKTLKLHVETKGLNQEASDYWRQELNHDKFKQKIESLAKYDAKDYWEKRARAWSEDGQKGEVELKEIKQFIDEIKPENVLDVGCGDARWFPYFKGWGIEYHGFDISENLVKAAQFRFPHLKDELEISSVEDYKTEKEYDLVFSYTCLEHIAPENFPRAVKSLKKMGKKLLLVEPIDFNSQYYCFNHDYEKYFKVVKKQTIGKKTIFLCDPK